MLSHELIQASLMRFYTLLCELKSDRGIPDPYFQTLLMRSQSLDYGMLYNFGAGVISESFAPLDGDLFPPPANFQVFRFNVPSPVTTLEDKRKFVGDASIALSQHIALQKNGREAVPTLNLVSLDASRRYYAMRLGN